MLGQRDQTAKVGGGSLVEAMEDHAVTRCVEFVALQVADEVRAVRSKVRPERYGYKTAPSKLGQGCVCVNHAQERPCENGWIPGDAGVAATQGGGCLRTGNQGLQ